MADMKTVVHHLRHHFREQGDHFAHIARGAACEQWINSEIVVCLNRSGLLAEGERAQGELAKRDVVIGTGYPKMRVHRVLEVKLLHQWRSPKLWKEKLEKLRLQMHAGTMYDDETASVRRSGLLSGIWFDDPISRSALKPKEEPAEFFPRLRELAGSAFPQDQGFTTQHGHRFEPVFEQPMAINVGTQKSSRVLKVQIKMLLVTNRE